MVRMRRADGEFPVIPPNMDFRPLSRNADKVLTTITLYTDHERSEWIKLGEIMLRERGSPFKGIWQLSAYLLNATDFEHDSARLLRMEVVGVEFTAVEYGQTHFEGFIRGDMEEDFRVGGPDYNPLKLKDTRECKGTSRGHCKWADGKPHPIVPEGYYIPPVNPELFNIVRGRRIEVVTGPVRSNDENEE
jgi:hypothetical protein